MHLGHICVSSVCCEYVVQSMPRCMYISCLSSLCVCLCYSVVILVHGCCTSIQDSALACVLYNPWHLTAAGYCSPQQRMEKGVPKLPKLDFIFTFFSFCCIRRTEKLHCDNVCCKTVQIKWYWKGAWVNQRVNQVLSKKSDRKWMNSFI